MKNWRKREKVNRRTEKKIKGKERKGEKENEKVKNRRKREKVNRGTEK